MGNRPVIDEDGIAHLARAVLERERDEVAESAARKGVLVWEESIVRLHAQLVAAGHRLGDQIAAHLAGRGRRDDRSEEHTSELQSRGHLVCRLLLEKKKQTEGGAGR